MLQFFINGKELEISNDIVIALTYKSTDVSKPTAQKNTFSKTIEVEGTPHNNEIFGHLWRLDSASDSFNPRIRQDAYIVKNGEIVERGYVKLDEIVSDSVTTTYRLTFFGGLGNFFYNLSYDSDNTPLTLADVPFDFVDENGNIVEGFNYDMDFVNKSWSGNYDGNSIYSNIVPCPVYSGYYDDYDVSKALLDYTTLTDEEKTYVSSAVTSDGKTYGLYNDKYLYVNLPRECDEWELRSFNASRFRPALKLKTVIEKICNPSFNGGYSVEFPKDAIIQKYVDNSFILLNRIDWEKVEKYQGITLSVPTQEINKTRASVNVDSASALTSTQPCGFNVSLNPQLNLLVDDINNYPSQQYTVFTKFADGLGFDNVACLCFRLKAHNVSTDEDTYSPIVAITSTASDVKGNAIEYARDFITAHFGGDNNILFREAKLEAAATGLYDGKDYVTYAYDRDINVNIDNLPPGDYTLSLESSWVDIFMGHVGSQYYSGIREESQFFLQGLVSPYSILYNLNAEGSVFYKGSVNPIVSTNYITVNELLGATKTPYDYLIGLTRLFGLKYEYDAPSKTVKILRRTDYYNGIVKDISNNIDYAHSRTITPSLVDKKYYVCRLDTPETYAAKQYEYRIKEQPYGSLLFNTGYEFNNEREDIFDGTVYQSVIPFRHNSIFFNDLGISPIFLPKTCEYTYYYNNNGDETLSRTYYGVSATNPLPKRYDVIPRLCCFDEDNGNEDNVANALVLFDGYDTFSHPYVIYNAVAEMAEMGDNGCHLIIGGAGPSATSYYTKVYSLPRFSKYLTDEYGKYSLALDFDKPLISFVGDEMKYGDGITLSRFWRDYLDDLYDVNSRRVVQYVIMNESEPKEAMKYFYWFEGSLWVLNEIADFNINSTTENNLVKCEFIKVSNTENYISTEDALRNEGRLMIPVVNEDTGEIEYEEEESGKAFEFDDEPQTPNYLCFTANQAGSTVGITHNSTNPNVEYSTDGGATWTTLAFDTPITLTNVGDKMYVRGNNPNGFSYGNQNYNYFNMSGTIDVSGNIMSLISATDFESLTTIPSDYCFYFLFWRCTSLRSAAYLTLPATTLKTYCYSMMFVGCTSLTTAPSILPATRLTSYCYYNMFNGCASLTRAPQLPATVLAGNCYHQMFTNCTSLTTAPTLPATNIPAYGYHLMFDGCTSLNYVRAMCLNLGSKSLNYWLRNVAETGTFIKNPDMNASNLWIPTNWTVLDGRV